MAKITPATKPSLQLSNYLELVLMSLYLLVHFITDNDAIDVMGPHWLYVAVIDGIILLYLLINRKAYGDQLSAVLSNPLTIVYGLLFAWAGGSYFYAIEKIILLSWQPCSSWCSAGSRFQSSINFSMASILIILMK